MSNTLAWRRRPHEVLDDRWTMSAFDSNEHRGLRHSQVDAYGQFFHHAPRLDRVPLTWGRNPGDSILIVLAGWLSFRTREAIGANNVDSDNISHIMLSMGVSRLIANFSVENKQSKLLSREGRVNMLEPLPNEGNSNVK